MTLAIVDPLGDYNTDNSTSWVANDAGAKCTYLPSVGEFWVLLETGTGPTASGSHSTNSHFLRVDETTGAYIAMADDPAGQAGKLFLWGPIVADDVNQLVIAAGNYVTTSGGTTIGGNCMIAWNYDGTVAWEQFWATEGGFGSYAYVYHIIYHPTLGALYCTQTGTHPITRLQSINLATGARTTISTYWQVTGSYRPVMDSAGDVWINEVGGASTLERRFTLTGTPSVTTIENSSRIIGRQLYDQHNDVVYWYVNTDDDIRYWDGSSVISNNAASGARWTSSGGTGNASYEQFASRSGYWAYTYEPATPRDAYFKDLTTFATVKQVTDPADTYSTEFAANELKWQFSTSINRAWWRMKQTAWKLLVWTEDSTRRRVSVCVIT